MKNKLTTVLLTSLLAATSMFAQATRTPPDPATMAQHRVARLTTLLTLTSAQQQQAINIFTNSATATATQFAALKTAHQAIRDAVKKNDTAGIDNAANTIGSATAQLTSTHSKADAAFFAILTPDQQTKLAALRGMGGPGGRWHRGGRGAGGAERSQPQQQQQ